MNPFLLERADSAADAIRALGTLEEGAVRIDRPQFLAGGTNLVDLLKLGITRPARVIDIGRLTLDAIEVDADGALQLGALARNADTAYHPDVRRAFPLLSSALLAGASPQIRNAATNGGNLLQRTRCVYFYDPALPCNKRAPGSGCSAIGGLTRQHAILGASEHCLATHPSDFCVALAALDAEVHVQGPVGARTIAFSDFHRLPGDAPQHDSTLAADELITAISVPANDFADHSVYLKIRDRASYAFALVSVAVGLSMEDGQVRAARVALGGVAHKPWRVPEAEAGLVGTTATADDAAACADRLLAGAVGQGGNDFKMPLARRLVIRAIARARAGTVSNADGPRDEGDDTEQAHG